MVNKQTTVEWFYDILTSENWEYKTFEEQDEIFKKAKQMEKQQIIEAYETSHISMMTAEQYYNETYELDKNNK